MQPFLLDDGSAQCIVLPAGADVTGGRREGRERLIVAGDAVYVAGEFRPVSAETLQQVRDVEPERGDFVSVTFNAGDESDEKSFRTRGEDLLKEAAAAKAAAVRARTTSNASAPLALPLVCKPTDFRPFMISANKDGANESGWYGLLANANLAVLIASAGMLVYLLWAAR